MRGCGGFPGPGAEGKPGACAVSFSLAKGAGKGVTALLLSAHTDDCELGMGGTIARLVEAGYAIRWLTFCNAWQSLPDGFDRSTLIKEQRSAASAFGVPQSDVVMGDIPVRRFPELVSRVSSGYFGSSRR